jgi:hypothetical protein
MGQLVKFLSLTRREKKLLCEAIILLSLSNLCVRVIAFRRIDKLLRLRWLNAIQRGMEHEQEYTLVQHSISRAANILPWKSLCLSRSIAKFIMLRRRGMSAIMFAGVKFSSNSTLDAHAWVDTGRAVDKDRGSENSDFVAVIRIETRR